MISTILRATIPVFLAVVPAAARPAETPEALSHRLCDAVQTLPETRKAQCCRTSASPALAAECARELGRALRDHAVALGAAEVDRCAADSRRQVTGCDWVTPYLPAIPASCRDVVRGRLDAGAHCRSSLECRDGLFCRGGGPSAAGVCASPGGPGAACGGALDTLATYTRQTDVDARHPECDGFCLKGRCIGSVALGGECSSDRQCAPGAHCTSRRCVDGPRPKLGEACDGTSCDGALVCVDGRCAQPKKAGEPCTRSAQCEAACVAATADAPGRCGMQCSAWPPAGYTPPVPGPSPVGSTARAQDVDRRPHD